MLRWRRMEKVSCAVSAKNEEVLHRVKEEGNILETRKWRKVNWTCHILRRNCLLKQVVEGKIEGRKQEMRRRVRRRRQILWDLKEIRSYWKLKEEPLDRSLCRTGFGAGHGTVVSFSGCDGRARDKLRNDDGLRKKWVILSLVHNCFLLYPFSSLLGNYIFLQHY